MGQVQRKGLKVAALVLAVTLVVGITQLNSVKADTNVNNIADDIGTQNDTTAQPILAVPDAVTTAQGLSVTPDSLEILAAVDFQTGYGSNGKFLAPIGAPDPSATPIYLAQDLANISNNLAGSYVLMNDIDLSTYNSGEWVPIGSNSTNSFNGTFDGQGHVISKLQISVSSSSSFCGLFGYVSGNAALENFGIEGTNNNLSNYGVGVICSYNYGSISNCYNTGNVTAYEAGGICGENGGSIDSCYNTGEITGSSGGATSDVGGICGRNYSSGFISNCINTGIVTGSNFVSAGGVCGINSGSISSSANMGDVTSAYAGAGGICGLNETSIDDCYNTGEVTSSNTNGAAGGVCGINPGSICRSYNSGVVNGSLLISTGGICGKNQGSISISYNTGNVTSSGGGEGTGGICGYSSYSTISDSFNIGNVTSDNYTGYVGGICGYAQSSTINNSYNAGDLASSYSAIGGICGRNYSSSFNDCYCLNLYNNPIGTLLSSAQMQVQSSFAGFDFITIWAISSSINNGYPYLQAIPPSSTAPVTSVPDAPTTLTATAGDAQATVSFSLPANNGGSAIMSYTVISSPDGITASGTASPITVTSLTNGTTYTFTVVATNAVGDSVPSAPSNAVTPQATEIITLVAPDSIYAVAGDSQATISFFDGVNTQLTGRKMNYKVIANPPDVGAVVGGSSPITVTGLTNGTTYTFTVIATDGIDNDSAPSQPSNPVTPQKAGTEYHGDFQYYGGRLNQEKDQPAQCDYSDSYFNQDATVYNQDIATMSLCLAMSAFSSPSGSKETPDYSDSDHNVKQLMSDIGLKDYQINPSFNQLPGIYYSIGVAMGYKTVTKADGSSYDLIVVAIRGGGYGNEWGSNFDVGTGIEHEGFAQAESIVALFFEGYMTNHASEFAGKDLKIWVTGYSRGSAVANLFAANLDKGSYITPALAKDDIFAYCFETPAATRATDTSSHLYDNIFCIVNPNDFVPRFAPGDEIDWLGNNAWGYHRYGITVYLPSKEEFSGKYTALENAMLSQYYKLSEFGPEDYKIPDFVSIPGCPPTQSAFLDKFVNYLALDGFRDYMTYSTLSQDALVTWSAHFLGTGDVSLANLQATISLAATIPGGAIFVGLHRPYYDSVATNLLAGLSSTGLSYCNLAQAHYPELCLAWMKSLHNTTLITFGNGYYRTLRVNCPVDLEVYDASNNLVASIINDVPQNLGDNSLVAYIDENGQKMILLPSKEGYTVKATATGNGTMTYSVNEFSRNEESATRLVNYYNVEIQTGDVFTGTIENLDTTPVAQYPLVGPDGSAITPSEDLSGQSAVNCTVNVNVQGSGTVTGMGSRAKGEYAKVTATPGDNASFDGWYLNNQKVSSGLSYTFCVTSDVTLVAKFAKSGNGGNSDGGNPGSGGSYTPTYPSVPTTVPSPTSTPTPTTTNPAPTTAKPELSKDSSIAYISGYPDGTVRPDNNITRAEAAQIFYTLIDDPNKAVYVQSASKFNDVGTDQWYSAAIGYLSATGIITGYSDGNFKPNAPITRAEFATMAAKFTDLNATGTLPFSDVSTDHWAYQFIATAFNNGWIAGYLDGTFKPDSQITRAEVITIVNKMIDRKPVDISVASPFSDLSPDSWYYGQVLAAVTK